MNVNTSCRSCGSIDLKNILSLGNIPLANALLLKENLDLEEEKFSLELVFCPDCALVQITKTISPEVLFKEYLYFSSYSETFLDHAKKFVERLIDKKGLSIKNFVVEIASNDGYLLQFFKPYNIPVLGIEPAENIAKVANEKGIPTLNEFFSSETAQELKQESKTADVIIGNNVLAHVAHLNDFVEGVKILLKDDGLAIFEFPYVKEMIEKKEFDTIYHEHLCYYSLSAVCHLFNLHDLTIVDAEQTSIHGGSLRITAMHKHHKDQATLNLKNLLKDEERWGLRKIDYYQNFAKEVKRITTNLKNLLTIKKKQGKTIAGYGAAAKGAVLLNYLDIDNSIIDFIVDRNPHKQGLFLPGKHIPIYSTKHLLEKQPDFLLILAWNFAEEIISQQEVYQKKGGKFIIPIPNVMVV